MNQDYKKVLLRQYLEDNTLMQLATVESGQPWVCNVYFVVDDENNIYWTSSKKRRHSKEINANPIVAATIVQDSDKKQALQITGKAYQVSLDESERVNMLYGAKFGDKPTRLQEVFSNTPDGRAYWVLKPESIFFWDEVNYPDSPKQEYKLP